MSRTYIQARLYNQPKRKPTKGALRDLVDKGQMLDTPLECVDMFGPLRDGEQFTIRDVIESVGEHIGIELRWNDHLAGMLNADRHPSGLIGVTVK